MPMALVAAVVLLGNPGKVFGQTNSCNCGSFSLINPSFEQPGVPAGSLQFFNQNSFPGWRTTDPSGRIEIWGSGFGGVPAYQGTNFAELNADNPGSLFQDVATCPGQVYSWGAAHRGRGGIETAALEFGPPGGPYVPIQTMTDGTSAWGTYSGTYVIPAGQTTTRVRPTAVVATSLSVGNFVDAFQMTPIFCTTDDDGDGFTELQGDCNDNDNTIYPNAPELCDNKDNNCNNIVDDETVAPVITCPVNIVVGTDAGMCGAVVNYNAPTVTDNCATCPSGAIAGYTFLGTFGGHKYYKSNSTGTWTSFNAAASAMGGHLVTIGSAAENSFLSSAGTAWMGFTDQATEGSFVWVNGEPVSYTNWCGGEPNDQFGEDYACVNWGVGGCWNDRPNLGDLPAVIEFDCITPVRTAGPASGSTFQPGTTTISYTATDKAGNSSSCSFTVTVNDDDAPAISCPASVTVDCQASTAPSSTGTATATDNCDNSPDVVYNDVVTLGNCPGNYVIIRTWSATDNASNTSTCMQTITVQDNTAPTAVCQNVTVTLANGTATVTAADVNNGSTDNCSGIASMTLSKTSFNCTNIGSNPVTLTLTDACGNTSSCNATVTVQGDVPSCSIAVTPSNTTYTGGVPTNLYLGYGPQSATLTVTPAGGTGFTYSWSGPTSSLSCTNCANPVFTPTTAGNYTFTVTVTNSNGCTTTCMKTFCVKNVKAPTNGNNDKVYICHNGNTLNISVNAVGSHIGNHAGDYLGQCNQTCGSNMAKMAGGGNDGIGELIIDQDLEMAVYPNPTNSEFHLFIESISTDVANVMVYDLSGRIVERAPATHTNTEVVLGRNLTPGVYFVEVRHGSLSKKIKVVKL